MGACVGVSMWCMGGCLHVLYGCVGVGMYVGMSNCCLGAGAAQATAGDAAVWAGASNVCVCGCGCGCGYVGRNQLQEQELATLLYGLVTFCYKPDQPEMAVLVARAGSLIERGRATPWQLTAYITALVRLRQRVLPPFAKATLRACYLALPRFTNVGLAYMLWGVARLAVWRDNSRKRKRVSRLLWHVPPDWLAAVCKEVRSGIMVLHQSCC
ncbi:hypothetical protein DUNSADRAFT_2295 [Dunaliella salina]|uniref:Encoded protein n=1 Tax=Dunaliella salina TaxID=3046 RepID=A0ABQ7GVW1_DUNSA|nr:hypothetical protein DUNSADRAFT_2295 [Dunaliella salina]|eukprot:KAF5838751.1 hypothetical protein DUNSADRAFT_2295 [Dunaliella salina]